MRPRGAITLGGALVEFGAREWYHYASTKLWRGAALDAVALLEAAMRGAPIERPAVLDLRRRCQQAQRAEVQS